MNFSKIKLPSSSKEIERYWSQCIQNRLDFTEVNIHGKRQMFNLPADYFNMNDSAADKIALIGRKHSFFSQPVSMMNFELDIFSEISPDTQISGLLKQYKTSSVQPQMYMVYLQDTST